MSIDAFGCSDVRVDKLFCIAQDAPSPQRAPKKKPPKDIELKSVLEFNRIMRPENPNKK